MKGVVNIYGRIAWAAIAFAMMSIACDMQAERSSSPQDRPIVRRICETVPATQPASAISPEVFFSPRGGCTDAICNQIAKARKSILVQAYSFTSQPISDALIAAHARGIEVIAILDKSNTTARASAMPQIRDAGIATYIDAKHSIAHNKVILIDDAIVITGSFNFTGAAEKSNAENLLILESPDVAAVYRENFQVHLEHSVRQMPTTRPTSMPMNMTTVQ